MKGLFRWLGVLALLVCMVSSVSMSAGNTDLQDLCTGKNNSNCPYKVDANGNVTTLGGVTATGVGSFAGGLTAPTFFTPPIYTAAQVATLTAGTTGQVLFCSNCSNWNASKGGVCQSSGTTVGAWIAISSATAVTSCQ